MKHRLAATLALASCIPAFAQAKANLQAVTNVRLQAAERRRVVDAVITNVMHHYVDPVLAQKVATSLRASERRGEYDAIVGGTEFADELTKEIRKTTGDPHLAVIYSSRPLPACAPCLPPGAAARYRITMQEDNCTFQQVVILPHDIGYLKLNSFPQRSVCRSTAAAAMSNLNRAEESFSICETTGAVTRTWSH